MSTTTSSIFGSFNFDTTRIKTSDNDVVPREIFRLVWFNAAYDENNPIYESQIEKIHAIICDLFVFETSNDCIQFIQNIYAEKLFVILSMPFEQDLIDQLHQLTQISAIFLFNDQPIENPSWTRNWLKIRGNYHQIDSLCEDLHRSIRLSDAKPIDVIEAVSSSSGENANHLDPSYMYTILLKDIFLHGSPRHNVHLNLVRFLRNAKPENRISDTRIKKFEEEYNPVNAIWWYTYETFLYENANLSLRLLNVDMILLMDFFIHDLHLAIAQLHRIQQTQRGSNLFEVYRGQALSLADFEKLKNSKGILGFNCFLSTTTNAPVAYMFAECSAVQTNKVGVVFIMTVDPSTPGMPYADVAQKSNFEDEREILFSMHSTFRIKSMTPAKDRNNVYELKLELTAHNDHELETLRLRLNETVQGHNGWATLANLLAKMGRIDQAEVLLNNLIKQSSFDEVARDCFMALGEIKLDQGAYAEAIKYCKSAINLAKDKSERTNDLTIAAYNNIAHAYRGMNKISLAMKTFEKSLEIIRNTNLKEALAFHNIGSMFFSMGKLEEAKSYLAKALKIREYALPNNHPWLAETYHNLAFVCKAENDNPQALSLFLKALDIQERSLPSNHLDLAMVVESIGTIHFEAKNYEMALPYFIRALDIRKLTLPYSHEQLIGSFERIADLYYGKGEYATALSYYMEVYDRLVKSEPSPICGFQIAGLVMKLASVYNDIHESSTVIDDLINHIKLQEEMLRPDAIPLSLSNISIARAYQKIKNYELALVHFQKAIDIELKYSPQGSRRITDLRKQIETIQKKMTV